MADSRSAPIGAGKVPGIVLTFRIVKTAAATLGQTGGDAVIMTMNLGYLVGTTFSRPLASAVLPVFILACIALLAQRAG